MRIVITLVVGLLALVGSACTSSDIDEGLDPPEPLPTWIDEITPRPNATFSPAEGITVRFDLTDPDTEVLLLIDGTDVTSVSNDTPGFLRYETGDEGIVPLGPGMHTAEAQLVELPTAGVETVVIDSYTWTFRVA
jgi:hypothetical protein